MKTYAKIVDDIVVYTMKSAVNQPDLTEINFSIGQPPMPDHVFKFSTLSWVDAKTNEEKLLISIDNAKKERNRLLQFSDWTQMPDVQLLNKSDWAVYRQALRDITIQPGYPINIVWPISPQG